jgi:hypothetical protein
MKERKKGRMKERKGIWRKNDAVNRHFPSFPLSYFLSQGQDGVIALLTIIIISAMILAVGVSAALIGQTEIALSGQSDREYAARSLASMCVEEALHRLKLNPAYVGGTLPIGTSDSCTVAVTGSGNNRTITATASSDVFTKSIVVATSIKQNGQGNAKAWHVDSYTEGDPP